MPAQFELDVQTLYPLPRHIPLKAASSYAVSLLWLHEIPRAKLLQTNTSSTQKPTYEQEAKGARSKKDGDRNEMDGAKGGTNERDGAECARSEMDDTECTNMTTQKKT